MCFADCCGRPALSCQPRGLALHGRPRQEHEYHSPPPVCAGFSAKYACGTPCYCPPEVLANWEHAHCLVDRRLHDVFGIGAMLFEARPLGRVGAWWVETIPQGCRGPLRRAVLRTQASTNKRRGCSSNHTRQAHPLHSLDIIPCDAALARSCNQVHLIAAACQTNRGGTC